MNCLDYFTPHVHEKYTQSSPNPISKNNVMPRPHRVELGSHCQIIQPSRAVLPVEIRGPHHSIRHAHRCIVRYELAQRIQVPP